MNRNFFGIGLMSGTSMDGVDVSIIKSDGERHLELIDDMYIKYDEKLRLSLNKIIRLCISKKELIKFSKEIKDIESEITLYHAKAFDLITKKNKGIKIDIVGFHGQTVLHKPQKGYSIQIGDSNLLAKLTKTKVVSNFRNNDIANGGQGAPITPLYHQLILNKIKLDFPSAIVNIGGISNITYIEKNNIISFDMGPGNFLIDQWIKQNTKQEYDKDGLIAKSGKINEKLLNKFFLNPYYKKNYPKSLDVKDLNFQSLNQLDLKDGAATLSMLTVKSIHLALNFFKTYPKQILFAGGGRKNKFIINNLKKLISKCSVNLIDEYNFNGDFIESQAFAYLAIRSYLNKYITLPSTTGVKKNCLGGTIFNI